jgi:putative ABC transport system ATP-binding protein
MTPRAIVEARSVGRVFPMPAGPVTALRDVSLRIDAADYVAITGPSGCGKSTLLHLVGCVDAPTSGSIVFEDRDVQSLGETARSRIRLTRIGFVFQRFFLLPMLTAGENIELPQAEAGVPAAARPRPHGGTARVRRPGQPGRPSTLAALGGEMQRTAIARALANRPALLVADEPTGELDEETGDHVAALFDRVHADGTAILMVTHNAALAARATRRFAMKNGMLAS